MVTTAESILHKKKSILCHVRQSVLWHVERITSFYCHFQRNSGISIDVFQSNGIRVKWWTNWGASSIFFSISLRRSTHIWIIVYQCRWRCLWPNSMVLFAHKTFAKKIRQHHRSEHQQEFSCRNEKAFVQFTMKSPDVNCIDTWRVGKYKYLYTKCVHFRAIQWCLYKSWTSRWRTKTFQNFLVLAK